MSMFVQLPQHPEGDGSRDRRRRRLDFGKPERSGVQRKLRRGGLAGFEPVTQAALLTLLERAGPRPVFFDVGAHIGLFSALVTAVLEDSGVRAYAFEASPETMYIAQRVRNRNKLDYRLVAGAVSSKTGHATLFLSDRGEASNSLNPDFRPHSSSVEVLCTTIDAYVEFCGVRPDVVKIDVETHEGDVLLGSFDTITSARPWLVCEVLLTKYDPALAPAFARLDSEGYSFYQLSEAMPWARVDLGTASRDDDMRNWLLAPEPLDDAFYATCRGWLDSVVRCTADTNTYGSPDGMARRQGQALRQARR